MGLGAARIHGPPGPVELPGVDAPFVLARISADRPHDGVYDSKVDVLRGATGSPVRCDAVRFSIGSDDRKGHGRQVACRLSYNRSRSNGREGTGIGNARRVPPCGVRRRHLFSC